MSPPAPPGKQPPRSAKPRRRLRRILSRLCYDQRRTQVANVADPLEIKTEFVCRLLHQQEFPRQLIREELVHYEALLKTNGRPFRKHHFIERLLAARRRLKSESAAAEAIGAALFALKGKSPDASQDRQ